MAEEATTQTADCEEYAPAWRPENPGDSIKGVVVGTSQSPDFGFGPYPIMTLETPAGEIAVHAMKTVLRNELAKRRPKRGDDIEITYLGTKMPKSGQGQPYHVYKVKGGQEPEFDWASESPAPRADDVPIESAPVPSELVEARNRLAAPTLGKAMTAVQIEALRKDAEQRAIEEKAAENFGDDLPF